LGALASMLSIAGCGGDSSGSAPTGGSGTVVVPSPAPSPTPTPTPAPTPTPSPAPTPTPTPTSPPPAIGYLTFTEIYTYRIGAGISLPSACSGFAQGEPPTVLPTTGFGRGLSFRFIQTPQVWAIGGEVTLGFDGRDGEPLIPGVEVALARTIDGRRVRLTIAQPDPIGSGLAYARLASVEAPLQGIDRLYRCVTGTATLPSDLPAARSGDYRRAVLSATAYVRDGAGTREYSLERSEVSITVDWPARQVAISARMIGTPSTGGPDIELGTYGGAAPIDAATGNFSASLAAPGRTVTGTVSGRFFGPDAVEVGAALGAIVGDAAAPDVSIAGAVFGIR